MYVLLDEIFPVSLCLIVMLRLKGSDRHPLLGLWFCAASMFGQGVEGIPWYVTCYIVTRSKSLVVKE